MIVNKLLSVKKDKNIILYNLSYDTDRLYNFLKQIEDKYRRVENVVIETTLCGFMLQHIMRNVKNRILKEL